MRLTLISNFLAFWDSEYPTWQLIHWTKRMVTTRLIYYYQDPTNCPVQLQT